MLVDLNLLGESVDRLITVDVAGRGVVHALYNQARKISGAPLALSAAQALRSAISAGDNVLISTGFLIPPTLVPETDGPIGALVLSKVLGLAFGVRSIIVAEKEVLNLTVALAKSINMTTLGQGEPSRRDEVRLLGFPLEDDAARDYSVKIIEDVNPSAIIAIEKVGRNRRGVYHNMRGSDVSERTIKVDYLFQEAAKRGILTVGVGDGGNEMGMGMIEETVRKHVPYGETCNCPCKAGIACETKTDHLIIASVSNWGVYGVVACLSAILEKKAFLHSGKNERALLLEAGRKGAVDGVTGRSTSSVDGLTSRVHVHIVELLRELVTYSI